MHGASISLHWAHHTSMYLIFGQQFWVNSASRDLELQSKRTSQASTRMRGRWTRILRGRCAKFTGASAPRSFLNRQAVRLRRLRTCRSYVSPSGSQT
jgi:hypothetical protein